MGKRILVIDDEETIRKSFSLCLESMGYDVTTTESGDAGISAEKERPHDLILLDLKMPGMNGIETLRHLRLITEAPVYIVTAFHEEFLNELKRIQRDNIDFELLRKPLDNNELQLVANSILGNPKESPSGEETPIRIVLYVTGSAVQSQVALDALQRILTDRFPNRHSLEVIDVLEDPAMAVLNRVIATPTAAKTHPAPERRMIGDINWETVGKWLCVDE